MVRHNRNVAFRLTGVGTRDYRHNWRLTSVLKGDSGFEVMLDATRNEPVNDNGSGSGADIEHGMMLRGVIRFRGEDRMGAPAPPREDGGEPAGLARFMIGAGLLNEGVPRPSQVHQFGDLLPDALGGVAQGMQSIGAPEMEVTRANV